MINVYGQKKHIIYGQKSTYSNCAFADLAVDVQYFLKIRITKVYFLKIRILKTLAFSFHYVLLWLCGAVTSNAVFTSETYKNVLHLLKPHHKTMAMCGKKPSEPSLIILV